MVEEGDALAIMLGNGNNARKIKDVTPTSISLSFEDEWNRLFRLAEDGLQALQQYAIRMGLCNSRFRSIVWQLLLETLPTTPSMWIPRLRNQRNGYRLLRQKYSVNPRLASANDDPLSQSNVSIWNQYFCDKELRAMIRQDVVRTFPNVDFFRSDSIHCTMINILFCYAREHPEMCYRQGMHEVLAPILFVMHSDHQSLLQAQKVAPVSVQAVEILDPTCIEEDAYWVFCNLMSYLASSYRIRDSTPLLTGQFASSVPSFHRKEQSPAPVETEVTYRLKWIKDQLLSRFDPELHQHVTSLDIPFQTFGIRWLRVLFGQEFPLLDLLYLWDAIFAEGDNFDLVNYVFISMLSAIREQLLYEDDTECLMILMRYPPGISVQSVVENALHLRKPQKYPSPRQPVNEKHISPLPTRKMAETNSLSGRLKKLTLWPHRRDQTASSSQSGTFSTSTTPYTSSRTEQPERQAGVVEGFMLNDPTVLRAELQHSLSVLTLVHSQLERYYTTLERSLPPSTPPPARAAVAGIKELCTHIGLSLPVLPQAEEVETASEADPAPVFIPAKENSHAGGSSSLDPVSSKSTLVKAVRDQELIDVKNPTGIKCLRPLPLQDPLRALSWPSFDKDLTEHISYCRVLGVCNKS